MAEATTQWTNLDHPELSEGWAFPTPVSKSHYFRDGRSLCGRHQIEAGVNVAGRADESEPADCRGCARSAARPTTDGGRNG